MNEEKHEVLLPPLPERDGDWAGDDWFTKDTLREYGQACAEAARHDADAAKRLRLICKLVGIESHVPADDETLWGAAFAVLGQVRAALEAARQPAPVVEVKPEDITLESWDRHPRGGMQVGMPLGVKLTHKPTATIICVDSNRSQHRNKALAMEGMRAILAATNRSQP